MIYGCDVGSRRLAIADPFQPHYETLVLPALRRGTKADSDADLKILGQWFSDTVPPSAIVVIEQVFVSGGVGNPDTTRKLAMMSGAVISRHPGRCLIVIPGTWKKAVIGNGAAKKPDVKAWVRQHHPEIAEAAKEDQDLYDAACMGLYGQLVAGGELEV